MLSHAAVGTLGVNHLFVFPFLELLDQFGEWCQFARIDQVELVNEIYEVLEARVQVRLRREKHYVLEVRVVDMSVNSEEPFEDDLDDVGEVLREWYAEGTRENLFVVELILYPGHQEIDVFSGADF